ncbi:MAG TPA: hypothetical protein VN894_18825 [Polyangiaceae bacterium]|nr:hypothetical protein [Polyangiaceae bacterium]
MRGERLLLVATPVVAMSAVALGLRAGAGGEVRAAVVFGAPASGAGTGLAWQIIAFREDRGVRQPDARAMLDVTARNRGREVRWSGATNDDGAAEVPVGLASAEGVSIEVRAEGKLLAGGDVTVPISLARVPPAAAWARFARRDGAIVLDVAVLGQRVASGFPASIWVRATEAASHSAVAGVTIEPEPDAALSPATSRVVTDTRGWAHVLVTPMGYGVALVLHARSRDGKAGDWAGALFASPGGAQIVARDRYAPDEQPAFDVVMPNVRTIAYVEIDDARGRAWGAALPLESSDSGLPHASVRAPKLAPGLYWAVASGDPAAGAQLGPGTIARPFFVASSDQAALAFGLDEECVRPGDPRETPRAIGVCLALAGATPVPRWTALDGFSAQHALDGQRRARGLGVALGAIVTALLLETVLLLRAARRSDSLREATTENGDPPGAKARRAGTVGIALLVALLGFALLAAFLVRAA